MAPQQIQWEPSPSFSTTRHFGKGFWLEDAWYFADIYGEDGRNPEEPQHAVELKIEEVLRLVVIPDEQGRYHFDEIGMEHLASIPGLSRRLVFVAHLPPTRQSNTGKSQPNGNVFVGVYQQSMTRDGTASHPSCKEQHASLSSLPNSSSSPRQSSSSRYARRNWPIVMRSMR